jgi:hypothetical protein
MGLDYSYIIIFKKSSKSKLSTRLSTDAIIDNLQYGKCATLKFKIDKPILKYLKDTIRHTEGMNLRTTFFFKTEKFPDYFEGDFGKIGCIYIDEKSFSNDKYVMVSFSAATTAMSVLFQNSLSIRHWFINLSAELNALTTFLDLEDNGIKFIYKSGKEVDVDFTDNTQVVSSDFDFYKKIYQEYDGTTYIK